MVKKILIAVITLGAVAFLGLNGKKLLKERASAVESEPKPKPTPISVVLVEPKMGSLSTKLPLLAQIASVKEITLSTKLAGFIKKLFVSESDMVKEGDLLLEIDSNELKNSIKSLRATLSARESAVTIAQKVYQRNKRLYRVGGIPKEMLEVSFGELQNKEAMLTATKEQIMQVQNQLSYLNIKAPFDGVVDKIMLHEGDLAVTGKPIIKISSLQQKLIFTFSIDNLSQIKKGKKIYWQNRLVGEVSKIYSSSQKGLPVAEVKLYKPLDAPNGLSLNIELLSKEQSGCVVPNRSILHRDDGLYVLIYKNGKFNLKKIEPIAKSGDAVLVKSCFDAPIAKASESKLALLPTYGEISLIREEQR